MSNLRKYRESLNISQTTLAKAVGCTQGAIGHWESGRRFSGCDDRTYQRKRTDGDSYTEGNNHQPNADSQRGSEGKHERGGKHVSGAKFRSKDTDSER